MTRAERRHRAERMKRRVQSYYGGYWRELPPERQGRTIGMLARTRTPCSCWACNTNYWPLGERIADTRRRRALEDL